MSTPPKRTIKVEFAPGRFMDVPYEQSPPQWCLAKLARQPNGTYILVPVQWHTMVRMSRRLCRNLGLDFAEHSLRRLVRAGFVRGHMVGPNTTMVDLESLNAHIEATRVDDGKEPFWTAERVRRYRDAFCTTRTQPESIQRIP